LGNVEIPFSLLQHLELAEGTYTAVIWSEKSLMALEPGDQTDYLYGAAIDIGTTTVVTSLIDMMTGKEMGTVWEQVEAIVHKYAWSDCDTQRPILRKEFAVLADELCNPFARAVNIKGESD